MALREIGRDAKTGQFIPVKEAKRRPSTTVVEKLRPAVPPRCPRPKPVTKKIGRN